MDDFQDIKDINQEITSFETPKYGSDVGAESIKDTAVYEESTGQVEQGVIKWVYNPGDILQQFQMYLRGVHLNHSTSQFEQLYKGYYMENNEKVFIPYKLMNDKGINDAMSIFTIYVNKVTSFSRYKAEEIDLVAKFLLFDLHERFIVHQSKEFEINPKDGFLIVNMMYDLIRSGWRQSLGGSSLDMLKKATKTTEVIGQQSSANKKPKWKFW